MHSTIPSLSFAFALLFTRLQALPTGEPSAALSTAVSAILLASPLSAVESPVSTALPVAAAATAAATTAPSSPSAVVSHTSSSTPATVLSFPLQQIMLSCVPDIPFTPPVNVGIFRTIPSLLDWYQAARNELLQKITAGTTAGLSKLIDKTIYSGMTLNAVRHSRADDSIEALEMAAEIETESKSPSGSSATAKVTLAKRERAVIRQQIAKGALLTAYTETVTRCNLVQEDLNASLTAARINATYTRPSARVDRIRRSLADCERDVQSTYANVLDLDLYYRIELPEMCKKLAAQMEESDCFALFTKSSIARFVPNLDESIGRLLRTSDARRTFEPPMPVEVPSNRFMSYVYSWSPFTTYPVALINNEGKDQQLCI